jgi:hypothetical protein
MYYTGPMLVFAFWTITHACRYLGNILLYMSVLASMKEGDVLL